MRRRDLLALIGAGALVAPQSLFAQERAVPVIGYLNARSADEATDIVAAFQNGLRDAGFVEKQSVRIEARFAEGRFDLLSQLAADLIRQSIDVLVATGGTVTVVNAKPIVPPSIPIVFAMGGDPVKLGVVASLNKPGGNITGVTFLVNGLAGKCIEMLHDLVPQAAAIGLVVNPNDPNAKSDTQEAQAAANAFHQKLVLGGEHRQPNRGGLCSVRRAKGAGPPCRYGALPG